MENQSLASDSAQMEVVSKKLPSKKIDSAFSNRMREVFGNESPTAFGRRCGIGEGTLRTYVNGTLPVIDKAIAIADAANVNIEWLAAGRGPKLRGSSAPSAPTIAHVTQNTRFDDYDRLVLTISTVEAALAASRKVLPPEKHAQVIAISYKILADRDQRDNVVEFIKMAG